MGIIEITEIIGIIGTTETLETLEIPENAIIPPEMEDHQEEIEEIEVTEEIEEIGATGTINLLMVSLNVIVMTGNQILLVIQINTIDNKIQIQILIVQNQMSTMEMINQAVLLDILP